MQTRTERERERERDGMISEITMRYRTFREPANITHVCRKQLLYSETDIVKLRLLFKKNKKSNMYSFNEKHY